LGVRVSLPAPNFENIIKGYTKKKLGLMNPSFLIDN
jgi:hypothetical protein